MAQTSSALFSLYRRYYLETSEADVILEQKEAQQPAGASIGTQEQAKKAAQEEFLRKKSEERKIAEEEQLRLADERRNAAKEGREKKKQEEETRKKAVEARKKAEEEARTEAARKRRGEIQAELSKQPTYDRAPEGVPRVLSWTQRADGT